MPLPTAHDISWRDKMNYKIWHNVNKTNDMYMANQISHKNTSIFGHVNGILC